MGSLFWTEAKHSSVTNKELFHHGYYLTSKVWRIYKPIQNYLKLLLCEAHANGFRNFSYETHKSADLLNNDLCDIIQALKDIKSVVLSPSTLSESHALGWMEKFPMEGPVLSTLSKILASKANPGNAHDRPNLVGERNGHVESLLQQSVISSNDSLSKICRNKKALSDITYAAYFLNKEWKIWLRGLTHWGQDKMDAISQTTFSKAFSWMKMQEFRLRYQWSLFLRFELTIFQHCFR